MSGCTVVILAAGKGTRMKSALPKVLHPLGHQPLLAHVLGAARLLNPARLAVVVGHGGGQVRAVLDAPDIHWVEQREQLGTAHAVQCALPALDGLDGELLILNGDVPLIRPETLAALLADHRQHKRAVTVLSTRLEDPHGYGRMVRDGSNELARIVEEKDADDAIRAIHEINSGTYCVDLASLARWLGNVGSDNAQGEFYLTDIVALANGEGQGVGAYLHPDSVELSGINTRVHLAAQERALQQRLAQRLMLDGVTMVDPASCWLAADVAIGPDTILEPNVVIGPGVAIGSGCRIGSGSKIKESRIGDNCQVRSFSHLEGADLKGDNVVGPYARLRPGSVLAPGAKVGNFCELKKARIGAGSKINHLSYVGDAEMGAGVNVGAGTITCNYDGAHKHLTVIGDGVFIGSDTQLVAPVTVGDNAWIGAGTTVTKDVAAGALAISRVPQKQVADYHNRRKK